MMDGSAAAKKQVSPEGQSSQRSKGILESWPRGISHAPELSIGALVDIVKGEFPATTVSKIRFIEDKGLVKPHRTATGYRKYSRADVERIRFILTQQRDSYAPLKVIHEQLQALDAGHDADPAPRARVVASEGKLVTPPPTATVSVREIIDLTGVTAEQMEEYARLGLIIPDLGGRFPARVVKVVRLLSTLGGEGIPPRLLRSVRQGAERSADIVDQAVSSRENRSRPGEKERTSAQAADLSGVFGQLHGEFLAIAVEALFDS